MSLLWFGSRWVWWAPQFYSLRVCPETFFSVGVFWCHPLPYVFPSPTWSQSPWCTNGLSRWRFQVSLECRMSPRYLISPVSRCCSLIKIVSIGLPIFLLDWYAKCLVKDRACDMSNIFSFWSNFVSLFYWNFNILKDFAIFLVFI